MFVEHNGFQLLAFCLTGFSVYNMYGGSSCLSFLNLAPQTATVYHCVRGCTIAPRGAKLPVDLTKSGDNVFRAEFIPRVVGT